MRKTLVVWLWLVATPAMALNWVVKIDGVPAETASISGAQLQTLRFGARPTPTAKAAFTDLTFTKSFGATSLALLSAMVEKKVLATVTLEGRNTAGAIIETIVLSQVRVTAYAAAGGRTPGLVDTISLSVERVVLDGFATRVDWDQPTGRIQ